MVNRKLLIELLDYDYLTLDDLAKKLNLTEEELEDKLADSENGLYASEMYAIAEILELNANGVYALFFSK